MKRIAVKDERGAKFKRTMELRFAVPHVSQRALASIIKYSQGHDMSEVSASRRELNRARAHCLPSTEYGDILVTKEMVGKAGKPNRELYLVNPFAYLQAAFSNHESGFRNMMSNALSENPASPDRPWRLVLYSDEVVPGNQLLANNRRKSWVVYFSFLELKMHLSQEEAWCPLVAEPSQLLKDVESNISQVFACVIKTFFGSLGHDMRTSGVLLNSNAGESHRLWCKLDMILQDGGAQKLVWGIKGDAGTRMCMLCKNLVSRSSRLAAHDRSDVLVCSVLHADECQLASDIEIRDSIARLRHFKEHAPQRSAS